MGNTQTKWVMGKASHPDNLSDFEKFARDIKSLDISTPVARILYNRDINTYEKVKRHLFMEPHEVYNPTLFKDSDKFIAGLRKAIDEGHKVVIVGDYDVDGVMATSIAMLGLRNIGVDVDFYINNRFVEGYGFKPETLDAVLNLYPDTKTIITVDNGIVSFEAVELAVAKGIQVLLTDHHEPKPDGSLPKAHAIVNHKRHDCPYPFKHLSGAGVIYKMLLLLYWELELVLDDIYDLSDILAVSTIADVVSITDENRVYIREGLRLIRSDHRLFFRILNEEMEIVDIDEETVGYKYSPAINAIGRLDGCPSEIVEAIISDDEDFVREICQKMVSKNKARQEHTKEQVDKAELLLLDEKYTDAIVLFDDSFMEGIAGLIAGRLCERHFKPAIALAEHHGVLKGSARSTPLLDIKKALDHCADLLEGYGGHPQAGGLSLKKENLEAFKKRLNEYVKNEMEGKDITKTVYIDSPLNPTEINGNIIDEINKLKPYGQDFIKPTFGFKTQVFDFGRDIKGNTLRIIGANKICVLGFDNKQQYIDLGEPSHIAVVGCPSINIFRGNVSYQFVIKENNLKGFSLAK